MGILESKHRHTLALSKWKNFGKTPFRKVLQEGNYLLKLKARHTMILLELTIAPEETTIVQEILPLNISSIDAMDHFVGCFNAFRWWSILYILGGR